MNSIMLSVHNSLLLEGIGSALRRNGDLRVTGKFGEDRELSLQECAEEKPDIVLLGVSYTEQESLKNRLNLADEIRKLLPDCIIAMICDDKENAEVAKEVAAAKRDGRIDMFFYSSVGLGYLTAVLGSVCSKEI